MERLGRPFTEAMPTKLIPTRRRAPHVVASMALLNHPLALRTRLGIDKNPIRVLRLVLILHVPLGHRVAIHRPVSFLVAIPAEIEGAAAIDVETPAVVPDEVEKVHGVIASGSRTPLDLPPPIAIFHIRPQKVPRVL
ncbi:hypothetical protein PanWU01x14_083460 [Parasponia andersonii]|uniref:Uncharacterized protein n=1 Tax=Parasponia andersonii TaxID=3476 RepID=A0A2P5DA51_PARAD|nr:hypothetical protein PanWU01x14_083460 [Parasponia andersonii]